MTCQRCTTVIEAGDLRCAVCALAVPPETSVATSESVTVLRCEGCGAAVSYDVESQSPRCAFCSAHMHLEGITDPPEKTGWYVDFLVSPEQARGALSTWVGGLGWFRPGDLVSRAVLDDVAPLWWVAWVFDADAVISWSADSNAGSGRSDWAPHAGQTHLQLSDIVVPATRGLASEEARALCASYDIARGAPERVLHGPTGASAPVVEQFDVQRSAAREAIAKELEATAARRVEKDIPGSKFRNVRVAALVESLSTRRVALPAYVMAYRYDGATYRVVVSGHDETVLMGSAPYSTAKIVLAAALAALAVALLLAFVIR